MSFVIREAFHTKALYQYITRVASCLQGNYWMTSTCCQKSPRFSWRALRVSSLDLYSHDVHLCQVNQSDAIVHAQTLIVHTIDEMRWYLVSGLVRAIGTAPVSGVL